MKKNLKWKTNQESTVGSCFSENNRMEKQNKKLKRKKKRKKKKKEKIKDGSRNKNGRWFWWMALISLWEESGQQKEPDRNGGFLWVLSPAQVHAGHHFSMSPRRGPSDKIVISIDGRAAIISNEENSSLPATTISNRVQQPSNSRS